METMERRDVQKPTPPKNKISVKVRISLFFDGTGNNRANTQFRYSHPRAYWWVRTGNADQVVGNMASWANDYSNVSRLEENLGTDAAGYTRYIRVYTEGIGTRNLDTDALVGMALGTMTTGVTAKVASGINAALAELYKLYNPQDYILEKLTIDTSGFSRGAAAARYCIYRVLDDQKARLQTRLANDGWIVFDVDVRAVGLFDTVSSYGTNHDNDVAQLKLDAVSQAASVYQLAAAEEYRENFSLTNILSAGGKGKHIYLPGGHSDIGGGYVEGAGENMRLVRGPGSKDIAAFMLARGWYRAGTEELRYRPEMTSIPTGDGMTAYIPEQVDVTRAHISRRYSYIPLQLMAEFFKREALQVRPKLYSWYNPSGVPAWSRIKQYAASAGPATSKHTDWEGSDPELQQLRHEHLHVSFHDSGIGMAVRIARVAGSTPPRVRPYRHVYNA